jgi:hypothetical protein
MMTGSIARLGDSHVEGLGNFKTMKRQDAQAAADSS